MKKKQILYDVYNVREERSAGWSIVMAGRQLQNAQGELHISVCKWQTEKKPVRSCHVPGNNDRANVATAGQYFLFLYVQDS